MSHATEARGANKNANDSMPDITQLGSNYDDDSD